MNGEILSLETAEKLHIINQIIDDNKKLSSNSEISSMLYRIEYDRRNNLEEKIKEAKEITEEMLKLYKKLWGDKKSKLLIYLEMQLKVLNE